MINKANHTEKEQYLDILLQEAISLLKNIYSDRDDRPEMLAIEEFLYKLEPVSNEKNYDNFENCRGYEE